MARTTTIAKKLRKIAASLEELATAIESFPAGNGKSAPSRTRRSKKETIALKNASKTTKKVTFQAAPTKTRQKPR